MESILASDPFTIMSYFHTQKYLKTTSLRLSDKYQTIRSIISLLSIIDVNVPNLGTNKFSEVLTP